MVSVPLAAPAAVGANVTLTVQEAPAARVVPQVLAWVNGPLTDSWAIEAGAVPGLATVTVAAHRGQVSPVTLSLNGNDITAFLQSCPPGDLACIQDGAPAAIARYRTRLTAILERLRAAAPDAEIILAGAYDPDIGEFSFADPLFAALNNAESMAGATVQARFANPFPVFNPHGDAAAEAAAICALTLVCAQHDTHPSDAGYRALASLVWNASGYHKLR
jgi:lysophospholipase L1-like esterase